MWGLNQGVPYFRKPPDGPRVDKVDLNRLAPVRRQAGRRTCTWKKPPRLAALQCSSQTVRDSTVHVLYQLLAHVSSFLESAVLGSVLCLATLRQWHEENGFDFVRDTKRLLFCRYSLVSRRAKRPGKTTSGHESVQDARSSAEAHNFRWCGGAVALRPSLQLRCLQEEPFHGEDDQDSAREQHGACQYLRATLVSKQAPVTSSKRVQTWVSPRPRSQAPQMSRRAAKPQEQAEAHRAMPALSLTPPLAEARPEPCKGAMNLTALN